MGLTRHWKWAAAVLAVFCSASQGKAEAPPLVIEHVTVLPMTAAGPETLTDQTVVVRDGRIVSIAASAPGALPGTARHIDGRGKWLMPGLADMHVHTLNDRAGRLFFKDPGFRDGTVRNEQVFLPYIANGVTQVLDLQSMSETIGQRVLIESGQILGPHLALAAMIDGEPAQWPLGMTRIATTPEQGRQTVRDIAAEGYDFVKVYSTLSLETFSAIVDEARHRGMRVVGHIPQRNKGLTGQFFQPGFDMVAHAEEFAQQTDPPAMESIPRYVEMAKRNGTWLDATLTLDERLLEETSRPESLRTRPELRYLPEFYRRMVVDHNPYLARSNEDFVQRLRQIVAFNRELVRAFAAAGIPVLSGTDSPVPGLVPGFALHDELEALAGAGMSNRQVLEGTTRLACQWLGVAEDRGTVETGKRADLLLLDADPLANVANTRKIAAVVLGGRYLPHAELDRLLAAAFPPSRHGAAAP